MLFQLPFRPQPHRTRYNPLNTAMDCGFEVNQEAGAMSFSEALARETPPESHKVSRRPAFLQSSFAVSSGPSSVELSLLAAFSFVILIFTISAMGAYTTAVDNFGDSSAYMSLASAIRHWDFRGIEVKQFWGLPYAMAALSRLTGLSDRTALLVCSLLPSFLTILVARQLWSGWIAGYFAVVNFDWLQRSCLGGSEP